MANLKFDKEIIALLVIDPYNDFISEGGKIWNRIKAVAEANECVPHMLQVLSAAREAKLRVFYALHRQYLEMKLEVVVVPVSDVDRAKAFYEKLGWRLDMGDRLLA